MLSAFLYTSYDGYATHLTCEVLPRKTLNPRKKYVNGVEHPEHLLASTSCLIIVSFIGPSSGRARVDNAGTCSLYMYRLTILGFVLSISFGSHTNYYYIDEKVTSK